MIYMRALAWLGFLCWVQLRDEGEYTIYVHISIYICCMYVCISMAIGKWRCQVTRSLCAGCRRLRCFRSFIAFVAAGANPPDIFILHMSNAHTHTHTQKHKLSLIKMKHAQAHTALPLPHTFYFLHSPLINARRWGVCVIWPRSSYNNA